MNEPEKLTTFEKDILLSVINHAIAYRLNNGSRRTELHSLKEIKRKLDLKKTILSRHTETNRNIKKALEERGE